MKLVCVSHSSRPFFEARCRLNDINQRFEGRSLDVLTDVEALASIDEAVPFDGALTIWRLEDGENSAGTENKRSPELTLLKSYNPGYKVQSACFVANNLIVCGPKGLEVLDLDFQPIRTITDPLLAGCHTVTKSEGSLVWASSAAANGAFLIDIQSGEVLKRLYMPDEFGVGHTLDDNTNLHEHFIPTDEQPCHVNSIVRSNRGLLATLWIPGAVVCFDEAYNPRTVVQGLRGCHGGRWVENDTQVMVTDSAVGLIWYFDADTGQVVRRLAVESKWVHDAERVADGVVAATLGDSNSLQLPDEATGKVLRDYDCSAHGESVMFVSSHEVHGAWEEKAQSWTPAEAAENALLFSEDILGDLVNDNSLRRASRRLQSSCVVRSDETMTTELLMVGGEEFLEPGSYELSGEILCRQGAVCVGLMDVGDRSWVVQLPFDGVRSRQRLTFDIDSPVRILVAVAGMNVQPDYMEAEIRQVNLRRGARSGGSENLLPNFVEGGLWEVESGLNSQIRLVTKQPVRFDYLMQSREVVLSPGSYLLSARIDCESGAITAGVAIVAGEWACQCTFKAGDHLQEQRFSIESEVRAQLIVAAHNDVLDHVAATVQEVSILPLPDKD